MRCQEFPDPVGIAERLAVCQFDCEFPEGVAETGQLRCRDYLAAVRDCRLPVELRAGVDQGDFAGINRQAGYVFISGPCSRPPEPRARQKARCLARDGKCRAPGTSLCDSVIR